MQAMHEISNQSKLNGRIPNGFESQILNYRGSRRYVAIWWSEDKQSLIWADGENWRSNAVDEDEWVWWTYTLSMSNDFNLNSLGFDINLSIHVLLLDLEKREVWDLPIGSAFDILVTQSSPQAREQRLRSQIGKKPIY